MVLADDLLTEAGRIVLSKGTRLTETLVRSLQAWNVSQLAIEQAEILPVHFSTDRCDKYYSDTLKMMQNSFMAMRLCGELPLREMKNLALGSIQAMTETVGALQYLHSLRRTSDYTFHHSVNVGILSGILGKWLGFGGAELQDIILAGLLHDVGKSQVEETLLNKPGRLNSDEMVRMREHSAKGRDLMRNAGELSPGVIAAVMQHHERMDGSGYPDGLHGDSIHPYARIIAVTDMYDAITSQRPFQDRQSPFAAARCIASDMFGKLDMGTSTTFLEHIRDHFVGSQVCLADGRLAEVVLLAGDFTFKPVIRTQNGEFLDMGRNPSLQIKEVVTA